MTDAKTKPENKKITTHIQGRDIDIEYRLINPEKTDGPLIIFLHEGLGSVAMWRSWPERLCEATNTRGLVYSRYGYGGSTPRPEGEFWPVEYMHHQARYALPALLKALQLDQEKPILYGHSDGGSIALLYAAMHPDAVQSIIVAAPHIFVEDISISSIEQAREAYLETNLRERLGRYHEVVDSAFWGWNNIWLDPEFRFWNIESYLPGIHCPILAIQGKQDEYGTLEQIRGIKRIAKQATLCIIEDCRHSPHFDQPEEVITAVKQFLANGQ